jgi:hypothetical protein
MFGLKKTLHLQTRLQFIRVKYEALPPSGVSRNFVSSAFLIPFIFDTRGK